MEKIVASFIKSICIEIECIFSLYALRPSSGSFSPRSCSSRPRLWAVHIFIIIKYLDLWIIFYLNKAGCTAPLHGREDKRKQMKQTLGSSSSQHRVRVRLEWIFCMNPCAFMHSCSIHRACCTFLKTIKLIIHYKNSFSSFLKVQGKAARKQ